MTEKQFRWDSPPHHSKERCLDVPGLGRYLVRREAPRARTFIVLLNGKKTAYSGRTMEEAMAIVERALRGVGLES